MHYYQFNIKDYKSHTGHLDLLEDLAYRRLLDWCYLHERPLPLDETEIARQIGMRSHTECIATVLCEFFTWTDEGYISERVQREIDAVNRKSESARTSAKARWNKGLDANALPTQSEGNATHNPLPITQDPVRKRGTRLDPDCLLSAEWAEFCKEKRPDLVPREVFDSFRDYWIAKAGQAGVKLDWDATWRNWVRSQKSTSFKPQTQLTVPSRPERDPALVKLDEDRKKREQIPLEIRQQLQTILRR